MLAVDHMRCKAIVMATVGLARSLTGPGAAPGFVRRRVREVTHCYMSIDAITKVLQHLVIDPPADLLPPGQRDAASAGPLRGSPDRTTSRTPSVEPPCKMR